MAAVYLYLFDQPPQDGYTYKTHPGGSSFVGAPDFPSAGVPQIWQELQAYPSNNYIQGLSITPPAPAPAPPVEPGFCAPSYKAWYYNQIHIIPPLISRGRLLSDYNGSVEVWNAYINETRTLNQIDYPPVEETGTDIQGVTGVVPPPVDEYLPLKAKIFNIKIDFEGPPSADALFEFVFDSETDTCLVTGYRLIVFGFMPQSEYIERYKWLTDLLPSFNGNEQYVKVRTVPRRELTYRYLASDTIRRGQIFNIISAGMAFDFGIPIWEQGVNPIVVATIGATEIFLDTSESEYESGQGFFIWQNDSYKESGVIDQVLADRITLLSPLSQAYDTASYVMPLLICKLPKSIQSNLNVMNGTDMSITFRAVESTDMTPASLADQYKSLDVLHDCPEVDGSIIWGHSGNWEDLDKQTGIWQNDYAQQYAKTTRGFKKTFISHSEMWAFRQWLYKMAGRVGMFWVPSYTGKLVTNAPSSIGDTLIDMVNADLVPVFGNTPFVTDIEFEFMNGDIRRHDVTDVQRLNADTERMTVTPAVDRNFTMDDVRYISLLHRVRLDSDTIEFQWDQSANCTVSFNVREVVQ